MKERIEDDSLVKEDKMLGRMMKDVLGVDGGPLLTEDVEVASPRRRQPEKPSSSHRTSSR